MNHTLFWIAVGIVVTILLAFLPAVVFRLQRLHTYWTNCPACKQRSAEAVSIYYNGGAFGLPSTVEVRTCRSCGSVSERRKEHSRRSQAWSDWSPC